MTRFGGNQSERRIPPLERITENAALQTLVLTTLVHKHFSARGMLCFSAGMLLISSKQHRFNQLQYINYSTTRTVFNVGCAQMNVNVN